MNSNINFLSTTIEFLSTKILEEPIFQTKLQISRLKKKCVQKMDKAQVVNKIEKNLPQEKNTLYQRITPERSTVIDKGCIRK